MKLESILKSLRAILIGARSMHRVMPKLAALGFREIRGGRSGHYYLVHPLTGNHKLTLGSSPSGACWPRNFVSQVRHAMWDAQEIAG